MQKNITILWADDEIDLLKPHILFLQSKGYHLVTAANADDALAKAREQKIDLVFLDENMPGKSGLEILIPLKQLLPGVPVIMITKSEEENIMDEAIGSRIDDYLIKPVNPHQVLLSIKKHIENRQLVFNKTASSFQSQFANLSMQINTARTFPDWIEIYRNLVFWELQLDEIEEELANVLRSKKLEANLEFGKFIKDNYLTWFDPKCTDKPLLSPSVFSKRVFPLLNDNKLFVIIIDNFRYDQWRFVLPSLTEFSKIESEDLYCSILPTATQYARNALFSGLMPLEIQQLFPQLWIDDDEEDSKNTNEDQLLNIQLKRLGLKIDAYYEKINNYKIASRFLEKIKNLKNQQLVVTVFNFVDILSHARTQTEVVKELVLDEAAYRSVTLSWFQHSDITEIIRSAFELGFKVIITTDHGSIKVNNPVKIIGDKQTSTNLRFKNGKNLNYNYREVFEIKKPAAVHLPSNNLSTTYIFALNSDYFVYPNNYNQFVHYYKNTFQHGGVSMEEMLVPFIILSGK